MTPCPTCSLPFTPTEPGAEKCPRCAAAELALQLVGGRRKGTRAKKAA